MHEYVYLKKSSLIHKIKYWNLIQLADSDAQHQSQPVYYSHGLTMEDLLVDHQQLVILVY